MRGESSTRDYPIRMWEIEGRYRERKRQRATRIRSENEACINFMRKARKEKLVRAEYKTRGKGKEKRRKISIENLP